MGLVGSVRRVNFLLFILYLILTASITFLILSAAYWLQGIRAEDAFSFGVVGGVSGFVAFAGCCIVGCACAATVQHRVLPCLACVVLTIGVFVVMCVRVSLSNTPEQWVVYVFLIFCLLVTCCCSGTVVVLVFGGLQVGNAFDLEIQLETARNVNPTTPCHLLSLSNLFSLISVIIEFFQLSRLSFLGELQPTGFDQAREASSWATLDFSFLSRIPWTTVFWTFVGAPGVLVIAFILVAIVCRNASADEKKGKHRAANVILVLKTVVSIISIIVFQYLLQGIACSTTPGDHQKWFLSVDPSIQCWTAAHIPFLVASLLATLFYHIIFTGVLLLHKDNDELDDDWDGVIQVHNSYAIASLQFKLALVALQAFFTSSIWVKLGALLACDVLLLASQYICGPTNIQRFNIFRFSAMAAATWTVICSTIAAGNNVPNNILPVILLGSGWAAILFFFSPLCCLFYKGRYREPRSTTVSLTLVPKPHGY